MDDRWWYELFVINEDKLYHTHQISLRFKVMCDVKSNILYNKPLEYNCILQFYEEWLSMDHLLVCHVYSRAETSQPPHFSWSLLCLPKTSDIK